MKLYHSARSSASYRVRIAMAHKGISYESRLLNMQAMQHRSPRFLAVNPLALVPALDTGAHILTQSMAIIEYLDEVRPEPALLPADPLDRAYVRAVSQLVACEIHPLNNLRTLDYVRGICRTEDAVSAWYRHWISDGFTLLETFLARERRHGRHCLGDEITVADCCLVPQVANAQRYECDLSPYPSIMHINENCVQLSPFQEASPQNQGQQFWLSESNAAGDTR